MVVEDAALDGVANAAGVMALEELQPSHRLQLVERLRD